MQFDRRCQAVTGLADGCANGTGTPWCRSPHPLRSVREYVGTSRAGRSSHDENRWCRSDSCMYLLLVHHRATARLGPRSGVGGTGDRGRHWVRCGTIRHHEARSDWIGRFAEVRARDVFLIEVALPIPRESSQNCGDRADLRHAEQRFLHDDYQGYVASCRAAVDELGRSHYGRWANILLDRLGEDRDSMSEQEREGAEWRHYAHQAHHAPSKGGVREYSRTLAQWMLAATARICRARRRGAGRKDRRAKESVGMSYRETGGFRSTPRAASVRGNR